MPELWNKYGPTAARQHGKPGREVRPKSVTIDIHAHVDVPEAAKFVAPHLDMKTVRSPISPRRNRRRSRRSRPPISVHGAVTSTGSPISTPWVSTSR